ncbi:MAG: class II aldolase/adducin family protein [Pseudomonadota bacterium]
MDDLEIRQAIIDQCRWMNASGLNTGTSGNISVRDGARMLITPSATGYDAMTPEMICSIRLDGEIETLGEADWDGPKKPSSEWRFHRDVLRARPEMNAVVHVHSPYCTTLSICRQDIPAVHYMIAVFGGPTIRCARYERFGSQALSDAALEAMAGRSACLLANHGMIAAGPTLDRAMWLAVELETLARQYWGARLFGGEAVLSDAEVAEAAEAMAARGYGQS